MKLVSCTPFRSENSSELTLEVYELEGHTFEARLVHKRWTKLTLISAVGSTEEIARGRLAVRVDAIRDVIFPSAGSLT